jgi:hypothetical protein
MPTNKTRGKHVYLVLSGALLEAKPPEHRQGETLQHKHDCTAVANALAGDNQAFDRERFLRDCGAK